ncbi:MAG: hypothetical protein ACKVZ6_13065 [Kineosporiaceae bacterium]|jgi:hypothetical protein
MARASVGGQVGTALRRCVYPLVALPTGLWSLALTLAGRRQSAVAAQLMTLRALLAVETRPPTPRRLLAHLLVGLPVNIVAFAVGGYTWLLLPMNLAYPLRSGETQTAWGGPTMAGAWTFHAVVGTLVFVVVGMPLLAGVAWLQGRLARTLLAGRG